MKASKQAVVFVLSLFFLVDVGAIDGVVTAVLSDKMPDELMKIYDDLPSVARLDSNYIHLPGGLSPQMARFFEKLDSVEIHKRGKISIVHIGGSHIQADYYPNVIRMRLDSLNDELRPARGVVFPYRAAKTNNPASYKVRYGGAWDKARCSVYRPRPSLGVCGISIFTADTAAWFSINLNPGDNKRWQTNRITVLGRSARGFLAPVLMTGGLTLHPKSCDMGYVFELPTPVDIFTVAVERDASAASDVADTLFVEGVIPSNDDDGIVYHTIGVNGAAVPSYLRCERFEQQLHALKPDLVIFGIGINETYDSRFTAENFRKNYDSLLRCFRRVSPDCAFIFITNSDSYKRKRMRHRGRAHREANVNGEVARQAFYAMATEWQGGLWDLYEVMGGFKSIQVWFEHKLAQKDCVHFSREGYELVGNLFFDAFLQFYLSQDSVDDAL